MVEVVNYEDHRGRESVDRYVRQLLRNGETSAVATLARYVGLLEEHGVRLGMPRSRMIDSAARIWELRPGDHRVAYAEHSDYIVLLAAWRKQAQNLDPQELARAQSRLADWKERH